MPFYTSQGFATAVYTAFDVVWADLTPVAYPNVEFKPELLNSWARLSILGNGESVTRRSGSTNPMILTVEGDLLIQCFVRQNLDVDQAYVMVERAQSFLQRYRVSGVQWLNMRSPEEIGPDGPWWQVAIRTGWRYFQSRAY